MWVGTWLSLVEHSVRDAGVGGSNPLVPTISPHQMEKAAYLSMSLCISLKRLSQNSPVNSDS